MSDKQNYEKLSCVVTVASIVMDLKRASLLYRALYDLCMWIVGREFSLNTISRILIDSRLRARNFFVTQEQLLRLSKEKKNQKIYFRLRTNNDLKILIGGDFDVRLQIKNSV